MLKFQTGLNKETVKILIILQRNKNKKHRGIFVINKNSYELSKLQPKVTIIIIIYLFTAIGLLPGGSGYFTCKQNMKLVTTKFKSGGLHEKHK